MRERARTQLTLKDVSKAYGDRSVLEDVSLTVRPGERAGVIGDNGSGKSTLLRLIAGAERPDEGGITVRFPGGTGLLPQVPDLGPAATVQDAVDASLVDLRALQRRIRDAEARLAAASETELAEYGELLHAFEERGGYEADARVDAALHGLGLGGLSRDRPVGSLSGGEQSRLALACVLAAAPELLLLDERDRRTVTRYGDGWTGYRAVRAAARRRRAREHQEWLDELARTEELVAAAGQRLSGTGKDPHQGFGKHRRSHEAKLSGQVRAARQRLERLRREPVPAPPEPLTFRVDLATAAARGAGGVLAELDGVAVGDRLRVEGLTVKAGERLLVTGPNGAGKSTLLRVLAGELEPDGGTVRRPARIGYLPQELPAVSSGRPLLSEYAAGRPGPAEEYAAELPALGLFLEEDLAVPVAALSAGQRRRLQLARLFCRPADLLVLDEPTNHVTPALVEELEAALAAYPGAVVVVSHDRRFRAAFRAPCLELRAGRTC
ncbi:ATP-binding cassette domain-containing protein [Streptomyces wuyuanensis]|uniref:Macrolide transport system ATP-binding/permease protein n=1 Tax=Streptomyces wuyuanensis TaxID=1196353 RepID=A0A1G9NWD1_9ACTN|nr:ATP-binding cassette domain-containing protein [Streptomyces wuyuanensis]SDL90337.1 macrolide transport system ATP-binding/permease protein [Streptomyces wuyuanensis]